MQRAVVNDYVGGRVVARIAESSRRGTRSGR